jgi:hypothetical protein
MRLISGTRSASKPSKFPSSSGHLNSDAGGVAALSTLIGLLRGAPATHAEHDRPNSRYTNCSS